MFNGQVNETIVSETSGHRSLKALRSYEHAYKEKLQIISRVLHETSNTDSTGTGSKDTKCISVKEEKIADNGESSMQDNA